MEELLGLVRYALGCALALAACSKIKDISAFSRSLGAYGLHNTAGWAGASALICVEALAAAVCFTTIGDFQVGIVGGTLGLGFTATQTLLLTSGKPASCLCFGTAPEPVSVRTWSRAFLVLVAGLMLGFAGRHGARPFDPFLAGGGVALIAVLSFWYRRTAAERRTGPLAIR